MAVSRRASPELEDTREAFDGVAAEYDAANSANAALCEMRRRTVEALTRYAAPHASVLDLGCGPGTDLEFHRERYVNPHERTT